jgi:hypothetical protein
VGLAQTTDFNILSSHSFVTAAAFGLCPIAAFAYSSLEISMNSF